MGKDKLRKFGELGQFDRVFQPGLEEISGRDHPLKGKWKQEVFHNQNPLVLELGCGKGEYTVGMARHFPEKNFIGIDIKGARMWKGAGISHREKILNAAFLRTRIEFIRSFFESGEVDEIWLTFPDPQPTERRRKKRLSGSVFLKLYQGFLRSGGLVHLKTDSSMLYRYTHELAEANGFEIIFSTDDLYHSGIVDDILDIKTYYEMKFLAQGMNICYLKFRLPNNAEINETGSSE